MLAGLVTERLGGVVHDDITLGRGDTCPATCCLPR
jgi:hypothetical protein